jgi:hypothetical protein
MLLIITVVCCAMMIRMKIGDTSSSTVCTAHESEIIFKFLGSREIHLHHSLQLRKPSGDHVLLKLWSLHVGTFGSNKIPTFSSISGRLSEVGRQGFFMTSPCLCIG